jgi:hypothetical protein
MAELPEGFVVDAPTASPSGLPEGFVLDQADESKTVAQQLNLPQPIVDASNEAQRTTSEAFGSAKQDLSESLSPRKGARDEGFWEGYGRDLLETPARFGKFARGLATAAGVPLAPAYGAAKSLVGRPMASAIHTAGQYINPEVAAQQTPGSIYEDIREDVGSALGTVAGRAAQTPRAPHASLAEIKAASQTAYKHPDVAAVEIGPQAVRGLANVIEGDLVNAGFHPSAGLGDKTFQAIDRMRPRVGANAPVTISDLDNTRRTLGRIAKEKDAQGQMTQEAAAAAKAIDHIDSFLPNLKQSDLHAGNAAKANSILQDARKDWASYKRGSLVDMLEENAGKMAGSNYYGGNLNNNIRQAFRPYGKFRHQKIPGWTDESKAALDRIVSGGSKTSLANMARNAGRLAPDTKLGIMGHMAAYSLSGGHTLPVAMAGYAAKKLGIALTKRNVNKLRNILIRDSALQQARQAAMVPKTGLGAKLAPAAWTQIPEHRRQISEPVVNPYAP